MVKIMNESSTDHIEIATLSDSENQIPGGMVKVHALNLQEEKDNNIGSNIEPTVITFSNITVTTKSKSRKIILKDISASIPGGFWAIMGSSGSGKTTLLSTLSLRLDRRYMDITGDFRLNGRTYSREVLKSMSAYVMQDDLMHAELTVGETLYYAARLRMPSSTTTEERNERIDEVLKLLGITYCRGVIIGNSRRKGISGGERKRVSIAIELLNKPKLLFLDEPTSGLDSTTAYSVCRALKNISETKQCTVISTIHQPQPKIFNMFDNVIIMQKGMVAYNGTTGNVDSWLTKIGHPTPSNMNVADHIIDVISTHLEQEKILEYSKQVVPIDLSLGIENTIFSEGRGHARNWIDQFTILFRRNLHQWIRDADVICMNVVALIIIAIFVGMGLWHHIGDSQTSIPFRIPALFYTVITQGIVGSLQAINSFPSERAIMLRERQAGTYKVSSYFLAKSLVDMLVQIGPTILYAVIVYPLIGFQSVSRKFMIYIVLLCLGCTAATSLATAVTCICVSLELSTVVLCLLFEITRLYGGFFTSPEQLKQIPHWRFADALSYIKYTFIGIALNELHGLELVVEPGQVKKYTTGEQIIKFYGYGEYTIQRCAGMLIVLIVGCRLIGYLGLRFIKT